MEKKQGTGTAKHLCKTQFLLFMCTVRLIAVWPAAEVHISVINPTQVRSPFTATIISRMSY